MPMYIFQNPETEEETEVFFHMNDEKKYVDEKGLEWKRIFTSSQLNTEGSIDPWDNASFVNSTANMKGSIGDMMDKSAELSSMRAEKNDGVDPLKKKYFENYSKERGGTKHHMEKTKTYESKNVKIDFD
mgnify:FL=1|jgi:hypothetical protein